VRILIDAGSDLNLWTRGPGCFPLSLAANSGKQATVAMLALETGIRLDQVDAHNRTALHKAALRGHSSCVRSLIDAGADANACDSLNNAGYALSMAIESGSLATVEAMLCAPRIIIHYMDRYDRTPLHQASAHKGDIYCKIVAALLKAGSHVNATDGDGDAALHNAVSYSTESTVATFLAAPDVDLFLKNEAGMTVLDVAVRGMDLGVLKLILKKCKRFGKESVHGETALGGATTGLWVEGCEALGEAGAPLRVSHLDKVSAQREDFLKDSRPDLRLVKTRGEMGLKYDQMVHYLESQVTERSNPKMPC